MKIEAVCILEVTGTVRFDGEVHRGMLCTPAHVYVDRVRPETTAAPPNRSRSWQLRQLWLRIEAEGGVSGQFGPISAETAALVRLKLAGPLIGDDALAPRRAFDWLYRLQGQRPGALMMQALSAIELALWDLAGNHYQQPVYRLLGGPTRTELPVYAQAKGISQHPDHLLPQARELVERGFDALKVFFLHGPGQDREGMRLNEQAIRILREGLGDEVDLMGDAWRGWDESYARQMIRRLAPYNLRWLEEPLGPEYVAGTARLRKLGVMPIAGGEHACGRFEPKALLDAEAVDILQPDPMWAGGLSESLNIAALASAAGVPLAPHTSQLMPNVHFAAALSPGACLSLEMPAFADAWTEPHFLAEQLVMNDGRIALPTGPGLGMAWDETKIESVRELPAEELPARKRTTKQSEHQTESGVGT